MHRPFARKNDPANETHSTCIRHRRTSRRWSRRWFEPSRGASDYETPKVDATDFYMFRSYETNREGFVTFLANYQPLQDPCGGPNYFLLDPDAVYAINIDNNGDAAADITYEFRFNNTFRNLTVPVNGINVPVPLSNIGPFNAQSSAARNVIESFTLTETNGSSLPQQARNVT